VRVGKFSGVQPTDKKIRTEEGVIHLRPSGWMANHSESDESFNNAGSEHPE
jgi:hypothetical protein